MLLAARVVQCLSYLTAGIIGEHGIDIMLYQQPSTRLCVCTRMLCRSPFSSYQLCWEGEGCEPDHQEGGELVGTGRRAWPCLLSQPCMQPCNSATICS
jgi:hypothetical protein